MKPLRISLRLALPLGLAALMLLTLVFASINTLNETKRRFTQQAQLDVLAYATNLARTTEQGWFTSKSLVEADIAQTAADPRVTAVFITDDNGTILAAQRYAWRGQPAAAMLPGFDQRAAQRTQQGRLPFLHNSADAMTLYAMQPFDLPSGRDQIGVHHRGLVYVAFDIKPAWAALRWNRLQARLPETLVMLVLISLTGVLLHWLIARPLRRIMRAADRLRAGDYAVSVDERGSTEIAHLSHSFNAMVRAISHAQAELRNSEQRLAITLHSIGDALIATDTDACITMMNPVAESLTGWTLAEARGRPIQDVFVIRNALSGESVEIPVAQVLREGTVVGLANHTVLIARDGKSYHIADSAAPIRDEHNTMQGVVLVFHDMSEEYALREALAESEQHFRTLTNSGQVLIWTSGLDKGRNYFNDTWLTFTGRTLEQEQGEGWRDNVHPDDLPIFLAVYDSAFAQQHPFSLEYRLHHRSGEYRWILAQGSPRYDSKNNFIGYVGHCLDVTDSKRTEAELQRLAYHDALTGLPNRTLLLDRLGQTLAIARRNRRVGALLFVDLDRFKQINDVYGHALGDKVLQEVSKRLGYHLRHEDTVARLGGDEFVVLLPDLAPSIEEAGLMALTVAEKIRIALQQPLLLEDNDCTTSASIGITLFPKDSETIDDLMREADIAMYRAKENGRNTLAHFESAMQQAVTERYLLEQELQDAIRQQAFELHLQSQVDTRGHILGAEALIRWHHPRKGLLAPSAFIPIAEETRLIIPLGEWVLRETCKIIARLDAQGQSIHLSVNVSPRQFHEAAFVERTKAILAETGADPTHLTLEITENLLIDHTSDTVARMLELQALGLHFSIDDFGTGYSSLAYLKRLPLSELKIDKSFVQDVAHDPDDAALVEAILAMANHLKFEIVAEGVENAEQLAFMQEHGCGRFQGYYFDKPIAAEEWLAQLANKQHASTQTELPLQAPSE